MPSVYAVVSGLNGLIFLAWAVMMFRTLFAQRRRVSARTGKPFPGLLDAISEWKHWWRAPELAGERRLLIGLTCALLVCIGVMAALAPQTV